MNLRHARWIAIRWLLRSAGENRAAAIRVVAGVTLATVIACAGTSVWSANHSREARGKQQTPTFAFGSTQFKAQIQTTPSGDDVWTNVYVSDVRPHAVPPPGLPELPGPGQAYVSPAVATLIAHDPKVAGRIPAQIVGTIGDSGLESPDELFAIVGLSPKQNVGAGRKGGWGSPVPAADRAGIPDAPFLVILALLVGLPLFILALAISQLSEEPRRRRLGAMNLLGVRSDSLVAAVRIETAVMVGCGNIFGLALGCLLCPWLARSGVVGMTWFLPKAILNWGPTLLLILLIDVLCVVSVGRRARGDLANSLQARAGEEREPSRWRIAPLVGGVLILALLFFVDTLGNRLPESEATLIVYFGTGVSIVGGALGLPRVLADMAEFVPGGVSPVSLFMASRSVRLRAFATARATAPALAVMVAGMFGLAAVTDLNGLDHPTNIGTEYSLTLSGYGTLSDQRSALATPARASILELPSAEGFMAINIATCHSLKIIEQTVSTSASLELQKRCRPNQRLRLVDAADRSTEGFRLPSSWRDVPLLAVPGLDAAGIPSGPVETFAPADFNSQVRGANLIVYPGRGEARATSYINSFLARDPLASVVDTGNSSYHYLVPVLRGILFGCMSIGMIIAGSAFVLIIADQSRERATVMARLRVLGAPGACARRILTAQAFMSSLAAVVLGLVLGALSGTDYVLVGGTGATFSSSILSMLLVGALTVAVITAATFVVASNRRDLDPELLRRE